MNKLVVSPSPHAHTSETVSKLMYGVIISMLPALAVSVYFFGIGMIIITTVSVFSCILFEYLIQKYVMKVKLSHLDGSAILTGLLLAFCLPSNIPFWMVMIGALVAIGIGKMTFGGLGNNIFNPALVGRVFLFISFPVAMTNYPKSGQWMKYTDAISGPTPLGIMKEGLGTKTADQLMMEIPSYMELFIGKMSGSAGEIAAAALLIGLIYLLVKKIITWHIPVTILATVALFTGILWGINPDKFADPMFHLLTGGLMLGAIYMATDYVTSPMTKKGMVIYAILIGILTVLIRTFGAYPEGVQFAILIMNMFVPLLNKYIKPKRFGKEVQHG
ncbi:MAG: RnfABCDGE type electron transport complex subunit D [Bacteroidales bacterium]|jgi:electron transport complex protein RnfD|nr:RnfABCDGE type electron transport complex subunit D [Bacteroidales bacterium]